MKYLLILLLLMSCATKDAIVPPPEKVVHIDARALEPCEPLVKLPDNASFEELISITVSNFELYSVCVIKQDNSIILLKKFSNKED